MMMTQINKANQVITSQISRWKSHKSTISKRAAQVEAMSSKAKVLIKKKMPLKALINR